jgi:hypothetical protein
MASGAELTEFQRLLLVAVDSTAGDRDSVRQDLKRSGLTQAQIGQVSGPLETLRKHKLVEIVAGKYRLTGKGRNALGRPR